MAKDHYVTNKKWEWTYHALLNPTYIRLICALQGVDIPEFKRVCELAYGRGLSLVFHAACHPSIDWIGTDLNSAHFETVSALHTAAGISNLVLKNLSFGDLITDGAVGPIDLMCLIGTWSWISPSAKNEVLELAAKNIRPGGLLCLDYQVLPGSDGSAAIRQLLWLLTSHKGYTNASNIDSETISKTLQLALQMSDLQPAFLHRQWQLRQLLETLAYSSTESVHHEFLNYNWSAEYLSELNTLLSRAGLHWLSAWGFESLTEMLSLSPQQIEFLDQFAGLTREQVKDFFVDKALRCDIWKTGVPEDKRVDWCEIAAEIEIVAAIPLEDVTFKVRGQLGEFALDRKLYGTLLESIQHAPKRISDVLSALKNKATADELREALAIMLRLGVVMPANLDRDAFSVRQSTKSLNQHLLKKGEEDSKVEHLVSPVTGGGIKIPRHHRHFLRAIQHGHSSLDQMKQFTRNDMHTRDGGSQKTDISSFDVGKFQAVNLPVYRSLGII